MAGPDPRNGVWLTVRVLCDTFEGSLDRLCDCGVERAAAAEFVCCCPCALGDATVVLTVGAIVASICACLTYRKPEYPKPRKEKKEGYSVQSEARSVDSLIAIRLAAHINIHAKPGKETQSKVAAPVGRSL